MPTAQQLAAKREALAHFSFMGNTGSEQARASSSPDYLIRIRRSRPQRKAGMREWGASRTTPGR